MEVSDFIGQAFENESGAFQTRVSSFSEEIRWQALEPNHPWLEEECVQWAAPWGVYRILRVFSEGAVKSSSEGCHAGRIDHWIWRYFNVVVPTLGQSSDKHMTSNCQLNDFCNPWNGPVFVAWRQSYFTSFYTLDLDEEEWKLERIVFVRKISNCHHVKNIPHCFIIPMNPPNLCQYQYKHRIFRINGESYQYTKEN